MGWTGHVTWEPVRIDRAQALLAEVVSTRSAEFGDVAPLGAVEATPSFYHAHRVVRIETANLSDSEEGSPNLSVGEVFVLDGPRGAEWLNGDSTPIHEANEREQVALTDDQFEEYLRFFLYFLRADQGAFVLVESAPERPVALPVPDADEQWRLVEQWAAPIGRGPDVDDGRATLDAVVAYGGVLSKARFALTRDGVIEMVDDDTLGSIADVALPGYPDLGPPVDPAGPRRLRDRDVTERIVSVLLADAWAELADAEPAHPVLSGYFNRRTSGDPVDIDAERIADLRAAVLDSRPVVIIESDIPFVEEFVAGILDGPDEAVSRGNTTKATDTGDGVTCSLGFVGSAEKLYLVSLHEYSKVHGAERAAHDLSLGRSVVLIGCEHRATAPEPLRRITDFVLRFPRLDAARFVRVFTGLFGAMPVGWDQPDTHWLGALEPADLHLPVQRDHDAVTAFEFVRARARQRLAMLLPDGPALDELAGLGEARQIAEDLVADIQAALAERDPARRASAWSKVDRGILLAGAPGTGKTTLVKALARASGINFVNASAAEWQMAGHLDAHLRAIRASFAQARRNSPAILFIDEIDSLGSRELMSGDNAVYQTDVINAVLAELQGLDPERPVIVVGATNLPERVDPALRRAGRLDQVVSVPRPNVEGLAKIIEFHLGAYRARGEVGPDLDPTAVAQVSLGLTGADIESFVRGASRRARRAGREQIFQADLLAEVTGRPRRPDSAPVLDREAQHRVAVHEAGHAVARLTSSDGGNDVAFVSIVPRLDGSLGFVASVPDERHVLTRPQYLEQIEVALGGRAAEEIEYGREGISTGAGGSPASDLAVATRMATALVCQSGLGEGGALTWSEVPDAAQRQQVRELLDATYRNVLVRLTQHTALHRRVVEILEQRQEISGVELRHLLAEAE